MINRRERTLQDICDVTPTLSQQQITPVLRGNFRMQGPSDEANSDSLTNMVTSKNNSHNPSRCQKVDYRGKSGTCNVCSAPCSSCFHVNNFFLKSNNDSAGETRVGNPETRQLSILTAVGGMGSTSDSFSENAAGKASSRTSIASASDDSVLHSKSNGRISPEGHDDCLSCVSENDVQANKKSDTEDSGNKYNKQNTVNGEISGKVSPSSSQSEFSFTKSTDDVTNGQKVQNTSQASNVKNPPYEESPMNVNDGKPPKTILELLEDSTEQFNSSSPNCVVSENVSGNPPKTDLNSVQKNDDMEVEIHHSDEGEDSDMVEQDVKVCDICGDAGREDLLAICSHCSDGAEHTYCMRERLEKVPEGEWLCEECKTLEQVGNGKQEKVGSRAENEKNNSSSPASENLNNSGIKGHKTKGSPKVTSKRLRDDEDAEVSSIAKKPALQSLVGSPKMSNPKITALSRKSSLKHPDRGRLQSPNRSTSDTIPVNDAIELAKPASDARELKLRGTFAQSNSFNSLNSKPKVKPVDQIVIRRQKSANEHGSFRLKEGVVRSIGKSMSFRSTDSNSSESKIKMLSPRPSHIQDVKNTKERSAFERQRSFRAEHPSNNSMMGTSMSSMSRIDKRLSPRVESSSLGRPTNHHEVKQVQNDGKSVLLRSPSLTARRTAYLSSSTGDFKRPSKHARATPLLSSASGVNNTEQKYSQTSLKQDLALCPDASEKLPINASEGLSDGLVQSKDITDSADQPREYSGSRFGPSSFRSSRDENDNLKAAIEAAVLRKPGVYRKHKSFGQSDESSMPTVAPAASHLDHMLSPRYRKLSSDAELAKRPAVFQNLTADPLKEESPNSLKQSLQLMVTSEGLSSGGREGVHIGLSLRNKFSNVPAVFPLFSKFIALPECESIWQGSFEICRSGQTFELRDGIQAHLSTCASLKVVEAVNKFKNKIVLYEVSRASTWPVQFQEDGVREDNIALFFFAKDLESYDMIYKVLLDKMMKNDLALKGNINGVELLIFPSTQLPVNLQRWNTLFFLWGVFRGKKESSLKKMPESIISPRDIPPPIMSLPENRCSLRPVTEIASQDVHPGLEVPASEEFRGLPGVVKRDFGIDVSPLYQLGHGVDTSSSSAVQSDQSKQDGEVRDAYQEGGISSSCCPIAMISPGSGREQRPMRSDTPFGNPRLQHDSCKSPAGLPQEGTGEGAMLKKNCNQNQLNSSVDVIDLSAGEEIFIHLEDDTRTTDLNMEPNQWLLSQREPILPGPPSIGHRTVSAGTSYISPRNDDLQNETCKTLEKVNHVSGESGIGRIPKNYEPGEICFFPVQSQPVPLTDGSMPWKTHLLDEAPNLELALGAERAPLSLGIEPLFASRAEQKLEEDHILEEARRKKAEDDVSASLSLSLSFPFPEKEVHMNTSSSSRLLFGNLRGNP